MTTSTFSFKVITSIAVALGAAVCGYVLHFHPNLQVQSVVTTGILVGLRSGIGARGLAETLGRFFVGQNMLNHAYQTPGHLVHGITAKAWWDAALFNATRILQNHFEDIREETISALRRGLREKYGNEHDDRMHGWSEIMFIQDMRGFNSNLNSDKMPKIAALLEQNLPEATSHPWGSIKLSVLSPGTYIPLHCGPTNTRIRLHLGVYVPEPEKCAISVNGIMRKWQEGEVIAFDDSFEHQVWHNGTLPRVVLIVDVWHPEVEGIEDRENVVKSIHALQRFTRSTNLNLSDAMQLFKLRSQHRTEQVEVGQNSRVADVQRALNSQHLDALRKARRNGACRSISDAALITLMESILQWAPVLSPSLYAPKRDCLFGGITIESIMNADVSGMLTRNGARRMLNLIRSRKQMAPVTSEDDGNVDPIGFGSVQSSSLNKLTVDFATPYFQSVIQCGGYRKNQPDASRVATAFASWGAISLLKTLRQHGYHIHGPISVMPVAPEHLMSKNKGAWKSALHSAAYFCHQNALEYIKDEMDSRDDGIHAKYHIPSNKDCGPCAKANILKSPPDNGGWTSIRVSLPFAFDKLHQSVAQCEFHVVDAEAVVKNPLDFLQEYVFRRQPVLVRGLLRKDSNLSRAAEAFHKSQLLSSIGESIWKPNCGSGNIACDFSTTLADFVANIENDPSKFIASTHFIPAKQSSMKPASQNGIFTAFNPSFMIKANHSTDQGLHQFFLGPATTGSRFHYHGAAWNQLLFGEKAWVLVPPNEAPFSTKAAKTFLKEDWSRVSSSAMRCIQKEGDLLIVPDGYGHLTYNVKLSISVARFFSVEH